MAAPLAAVKTLRRDTTSPTSLIGGCVDREDAESMLLQIESRTMDDAEILVLMIAQQADHTDSPRQN